MGARGLTVALCLLRAWAEEHEVVVEESLVGYVMGLTMVGTLVLAMGLWYLVHSSDVDVRKTTWELISNTTSIFCAVLLYSFSSKVLGAVLFTQYDPKSEPQFELKRYANQACVVFWYMVLTCSLAYKAGLHRTLESRKERAKDPVVKNMMAVSLLWAHVVAFTGIEGWGMVQTSRFRPYWKSPLMSAVVIPEAFTKWFVILWVVSVLRRLLRDRFLEKDRKPNGAPKLDKLVRLFGEKMEDGENDIYGLFVSFLIVQSLRFGISGVLLNAKGAEEGPEQWSHTASEIASLYLCAICILALVLMQPFVAQRLPDWSCKSSAASKSSAQCGGVINVVFQELGAVWRRLGDIFMNISTMSFAWCFMYATQWLIASSGLALKDESALKVLLATFVTIVCFASIRVLDCIADHFETQYENVVEHLQKGAAAAAKFARNMMRCVGFLVGFSWESAFDTAIEGITERVAPEFRTLATAAIGISCVMAILPAWWYFIVPMVEENGYHFGFIPRMVVEKINGAVEKDERLKKKVTVIRVLALPAF